ncbi:TonB-dependent receptor plug domain-containing protein [Wenyingzhuangia sp. IMCC45533]
MKTDSIRSLNAVRLNYVKRHEQLQIGQKKTKISVEKILQNPVNLTEKLRYNTPIVFKDFGFGGTSTASFRGTSSTNTQVLWNGITINSVANGQTDFNALASNTVDEIIVISGGGSVDYGSGAIGGVVILNDLLKFNNKRSTQIYTSQGSFNTTNSFLKHKQSFGNWSLKLAGTFNKSDNDFKLIDDSFRNEDGDKLKNENGDYQNYHLDLDVGYKINNSQKILLYSTYYYNERGFSAGLPNPLSSTERIKDQYQRNLLKWVGRYGKFSNELRLAYQFQNFEYFSNNKVTNPSFANSHRKLFHYYANYKLNRQYKIEVGFEIDNISGEIFLEESTGEIKEVQNSNAYVIKMYAKPLSNLETSIGIRYADFNLFKSLFSGSWSLRYHPFSFLALKTNLSNNFRTPTFNELFYPRLGNNELVPETSKQFDAGLRFEYKGFNVETTYFLINLKDKIIWRPIGGSGLWRPVNIEDDVLHNGLETSADYRWEINGNSKVKVSGNFIYTQAINQRTKKILEFVPKYLFNTNLSYHYKSYQIYIQYLSQGKVYTIPDEIDFFSLDPVQITHVGFTVDLLKKKKTQLTLGGKVSNVFNKLYYFTTLRPNPGRNYNININYKF